MLLRHHPQGARLPGQVIARGLSNRPIGQRELDVLAWVDSRWVVPTQDGQHLLVIDVDASSPDTEAQAIALPARVVMLRAWHRSAHAGVVALLQDGSAWWVRVRG